MTDLKWFGNPTKGGTDLNGDPDDFAIKDAIARGEFGCMITPDQGNLTFPEEWDVIADNGCFISPKAWAAGKRWDEAKWRRFILDTPRSIRFAVCPDVFYPDGRPCHSETLEQWHRLAPFLERHGFTPAFVCQVGATYETLPADVPLFIGGTDHFKLKSLDMWNIATKATEEGRHLHMGRVNSGARFNAARAKRCLTADGTFWTFGADVNLARSREWVAKADDQPMLWEAS